MAVMRKSVCNDCAKDFIIGYVNKAKSGNIKKYSVTEHFELVWDNDYGIEMMLRGMYDESRGDSKLFRTMIRSAVEEEIEAVQDYIGNGSSMVQELCYGIVDNIEVEALVAHFASRFEEDEYSASTKKSRRARQINDMDAVIKGKTRKGALGQSLGTAAGTAIGGPVGGAIGGVLGNVAEDKLTEMDDIALSDEDDGDDDCGCRHRFDDEEDDEKMIRKPDDIALCGGPKSRKSKFGKVRKLRKIDDDDEEDDGMDDDWDETEEFDEDEEERGFEEAEVPAEKCGKRFRKMRKAEMEDADEQQDQIDGESSNTDELPEDADDQQEENQGDSSNEDNLPEDADEQQEEMQKRTRKGVRKLSVTNGGSEDFDGRLKYVQSPMMRECIDRDFPGVKGGEVAKSLNKRLDEINKSKRNRPNTSVPMRVRY